MFYSLLLLLAISGYLLATILIARTIHKGANQQATTIQQETTAHHNTTVDAVFVTALVSGLAHLLYAINLSTTQGSLNLSLSAMTCLISLILTITFLAGSLAIPIRSLGIMVFPLTAISLIFSYLWGAGVGSEQAADGQIQGQLFTAHIYISILTYSLITIAAIQSLLYVYQERLIKNRKSSTMLLALPPLQSMEQLLFRLVACGFVLLTLTLVTGMFFSHEIFGQPFTFTHHKVFAILSWLVFAGLLFKRYRSGLRGTQAMKWTLVGFTLMQLGYFGTKIITESMRVF